MLRQRTFKQTNFYVHKQLNTDFIADGVELCRYIRCFMPKDIFTVNFIYVFFSPNSCTDDGLNRFRYDFVFSRGWLNHTSLNRLGICDMSLYRVYSFLSNPTLWQS